MTEQELVQLCSLGETTIVQYKLDFTSQKGIAEEIVAFANSHGGKIIFGAEDKTGAMVGLSYEQVQRISREVANAANEHVRPTIYIETEVVMHNGKSFLVVHVSEGIYKPYKDLSGNIWVKQASDKRRVVENVELRRMLQSSHQYQADIDSVQDSTERDLDTKAIDEYFEKVYHKAVEDFDSTRENLFRNLHIVNPNGCLTIAGLMYFGKNPQQFRPQHCIKAVWFYGNEISGTKYKDSRDIVGTIPEMYDEALRWLKSCLEHNQNGQSFNSVGELEISDVVLEEILQNALVHLDLLKQSAIKLLIFDNRIEITNPGSLPEGQTIDEIRLGNSNARNQHLALFGSKTMPYRGLGSGIPRVLSECSTIDFFDQPEGNQFTVVIWRTTQKQEFTTQKELVSTQKNDSATHDTTQKKISTTQKEILNYIKENPCATRIEIANALQHITEDGVKFNIGKLQQMGVLKREGGRKSGFWKVLV